MRAPRRRRGGGFRSVEEVAATAGSLLPRRGQGRHLQAMAAWRAAVGGQVDRVTRVAHIGTDTVTVEVSNPVWGETLRRMEPQILDRFRGCLGEDSPRRIEYRVVKGFWRPPAPIPPARMRQAVLARPAVPEVDSSVAEVKPPVTLPEMDDLPVNDTDLRRRLEDLGARYLARSRR